MVNSDTLVFARHRPVNENPIIGFRNRYGRVSLWQCQTASRGHIDPTSNRRWQIRSQNIMQLAGWVFQEVYAAPLTNQAIWLQRLDTRSARLFETLTLRVASIMRRSHPPFAAAPCCGQSSAVAIFKLFRFLPIAIYKLSVWSQ